MISKSTIRQIGATIYIKIPPQYVEYYGLKEQMAKDKLTNTDTVCEVEDKNKNTLAVKFRKWV